jgi:hypothetical protein
MLFARLKKAVATLFLFEFLSDSYSLPSKLMCSLLRRGVLSAISIALHFILPSPCRSPGVALPPPPPVAARMVRGLVGYIDCPSLRSPLPIARAPPPAANKEEKKEELKKS